MLAFIGSRTTRERHARGVGLSVYEVEHGGAWRLRQTVDLINPSYLLVDADRRTLYTVHGDMSDISAFAIDSDGSLTLLGRTAATLEATAADCAGRVQCVTGDVADPGKEPKKGDPKPKLDPASPAN